MVLFCNSYENKEDSCTSFTLNTYFVILLSWFPIEFKDWCIKSRTKLRSVFLLWLVRLFYEPVFSMQKNKLFTYCLSLMKIFVLVLELMKFFELFFESNAIFWSLFESRFSLFPDIFKIYFFGWFLDWQKVFLRNCKYDPKKALFIIHNQINTNNTLVV